MKNLRRSSVLLFLFSLLIMTGACSPTTSPSGIPITTAASVTSAVETAGPAIAPTEASRSVVISIEGFDDIHVELDPYSAPITVLNFQNLVSSGFYDGLTFHRMIPGFMIQGGDPNGDGSGGPGYTIKGEFINNEVENPLKHEIGVLSMARRGDSYDSAGSQFFIMLGDAPHLDGDYAAFGKVVSGLEVLTELAKQNTKGDQLDPPITIKSIRFE